MEVINVDIQDFEIPVSRVDVIDHTKGGAGRINIVNGKSVIVTFSMQDNNRTLKIFADDKL